MALVDDLLADTPEDELSRRKALGVLTSAMLAAAATGTAITTIRFLRPSVLFEPPTKVRVGRPGDIAIGTLLVLPEQKLYVARVARGFFAMSAVCTHLGCMTRWQSEAQAVICPCHGSRFDIQGRVTGGPAPRPLDRKYIALEEGQLVVDVRRSVTPDYVLEV